MKVVGTYTPPFRALTADEEAGLIRAVFAERGECRIIDLGKWASGAYVIASPVTDADEGVRDRNPEDSEEES